MTIQQDQVPAPSRSTSLQPVKVEGWTPDSALLVGMGFRVQCFLCCLAGVVQLLTSSFCLARKTDSFPGPLAACRFLLGLFLSLIVGVLGSQLL